MSFEPKIADSKTRSFIFRYLFPPHELDIAPRGDELRGCYAYEFKNLVKDAELVDQGFISDCIRSMSYADFLKTRYWLYIRKALAYRNDWKCQKCGFQFRPTMSAYLHLKTERLNEPQFDVHHPNYETLHGSEHQKVLDLVFVCRACHSEIHNNIFDAFVARDAQRAVIQGYADQCASFRVELSR